jgi:hypothetical protein
VAEFAPGAFLDVLNPVEDACCGSAPSGQEGRQHGARDIAKWNAPNLAGGPEFSQEPLKIRIASVDWRIRKPEPTHLAEFTEVEFDRGGSTSCYYIPERHICVATGQTDRLCNRNHCRWPNLGNSSGNP